MSAASRSSWRSRKTSEPSSYSRAASAGSPPFTRSARSSTRREMRSITSRTFTSAPCTPARSAASSARRDERRSTQTTTSTTTATTARSSSTTPHGKPSPPSSSGRRRRAFASLALQHPGGGLGAVGEGVRGVGGVDRGPLGGLDLARRVDARRDADVAGVEDDDPPVAAEAVEHLLGEVPGARELVADRVGQHDDLDVGAVVEGDGGGVELGEVAVVDRALLEGDVVVAQVRDGGADVLADAGGASDPASAAAAIRTSARRATRTPRW